MLKVLSTNPISILPWKSCLHLALLYRDFSFLSDEECLVFFHGGLMCTWLCCLSRYLCTNFVSYNRENAYLFFTVLPPQVNFCHVIDKHEISESQESHDGLEVQTDWLFHHCSLRIYYLTHIAYSSNLVIFYTCHRWYLYINQLQYSHALKGQLKSN